MLGELRIKNLAVVEDAVISFDGGLNVLTGATGAGKSIILTAVELLSGARARRSYLRRGAETLEVEGIFTVPERWPLRERFGLGSGEECFSIKREVGRDGRSRIWIGGMAATNAAAREATDALIELHGQHRQQELLDAANHILYLDSRGDYGDLLRDGMLRIADYERAWETYETRLAEAHEHRRQENYLRFQLQEIANLELEPGLDRELESRIARLANIHRYTAALEEIDAALAEEDGAVLERLGRIERTLDSLAGIDAAWAPAAQRFSETRITLGELSREIKRALTENDGEAEDIESLQQRLAAIQRAGRKLGLDCDGMITRRGELARILRGLDDGFDGLIDSERDIRRLTEEIEPLLERLSEMRRKSAATFDKQVTAELRDLGMKGSLFRTDIRRMENTTSQQGLNRLHLSARGWDRVEFMIRTNVGEDVHPLGDVASGGELSRITLVLKKLQVEERGIPILVFDEIDSGLGADLGSVVAGKLDELSRRYQIICITHLPQVAARAARHIRVQKRVAGGRTSSTAVVLGEAERVEEIARMLGGKGELRERLASELMESK